MNLYLIIAIESSIISLVVSLIIVYISAKAALFFLEKGFEEAKEEVESGTKK